MFSPSAHCTEAANKARRLVFMIRRSFQDLSKSAFIPLYEALVRPHLAYGMPACLPSLVADINHLERNQRLAKRLVTGMRHLLYEEGLQRLGLQSLQWRRPDYSHHDIQGFFGYWSKRFFLPPARRGLRGHPLKGTPRCEPPPKERVSIFGEGCEILE